MKICLDRGRWLFFLTLAIAGSYLLIDFVLNPTVPRGEAVNALGTGVLLALFFTYVYPGPSMRASREDPGERG